MSKRICVFGASVTWGAFDNEKGGWVNRLKLINFTQNEYIEIYNLGISGDTTENVLARIEVELLAREPKLVIFSIGSNDSFYMKSKNNNFVSLEKFCKNLNKLNKITKKFTKEIVFIGLTKVNEKKTNPISWDQDIYYTNKNLKVYDLAIRNFCKKNNLHYIKMNDLLNNEDLEDGLHPNAQGHEKMFQRVKNYLIKNKII